jgi:hypothetical protein
MAYSLLVDFRRYSACPEIYRVHREAAGKRSLDMGFHPVCVKASLVSWSTDDCRAQSCARSAMATGTTSESTRSNALIACDDKEQDRDSSTS